MARYLVQSKIDVELRADVVDPNDPRPPRLPPGRMRLYSYYRPSLRGYIWDSSKANAGAQAHASCGCSLLSRRIKAIKGDDNTAETKVKFNIKDNVNPLMQEFEVIAPQFSLDSKLINSYYPPSGHSDEGRILPHIVFQDPHVPWYRPAGLSSWMTDAVDTNSLEADPQPNANGHNFMPWMGLLVFKPADLIVTGPDADALGLTASGMQAYDATKLPANGAFQMTVGQYLTNIKSRVCYEAGHQNSHAGNDPAKTLEDTADDEYKGLRKSAEVMNAIFPTKSQIKTVLGGGDGLDLTPLKAQRLLSHVRHLNTIGFPDAGVEDEGLFSVVVSSMSGDQNITAPQTHIVHLVSLEHVDATLTNPKSSFKTSASDRIGLVSLFTWTYTCIPESVSFKQTMIELANSAQPLRPPREILKGLQDASTDKVKQALYSRLNAGYTIARWRTATGEESVAFNRGPLVPLPTLDVPTPASPPDNKLRLWPALSMTGKDYQVFDQSTGIMDITYSGAWSCGKLMAISDSIFNAALMRLRSSIWKQASSAVRMATTGTPSTSTQLFRAAAAVKGVATLTDGKNFNGAVTRINKPADVPVPPAVNDSSIADAFRQAVDLAANNIASATAKDSSHAVIYNGFDGIPSNNSDWEVVLNWVHDIMYLATIPAHMLFPEPAHLQSFNPWRTPEGQPTTHPEALRFFHIDHAWVDCFLDGALSVANHLEPDFDYTRLRIKAIINEFLHTGIGKTSITPPVPRYGFVIRSAVIKATPDLKLTATAWTVTTSPNGGIVTGERDCLLRHTRMDENTIFSLIDCLPEEIREIRFAQPAHQQRFQIECKLHADGEDPRIRKVIPDISIKRLYTNPKQAPNPPSKSLERTIFSPDDFTNYKLGSLSQTDFYDNETRCIKPAKIAQSVNDILQKWGSDPSFPSKPYDDAVPNSCILGIELNDSAYELKIDGPFKSTSPPTSPFPPWTRKLWLGEVVPAPVRPRLSQPTGEDITKGPKPDGTPTTRPQDSINVPKANPSLAVGDIPTAFANNTTVIPRKPLNVKVDLRTPFADSADPQFILVVHPAYKPPPPIRTRRSTDDYRAEIYSPLDYLPTETISLYDLVFAVRRRKVLDTKKKLKSITIEIPVLDKDKLPSSDGFLDPVEPLLDSTDWSAVGVSMCSNQRFVPTLYSGSASFAKDALWNSRQVLGITLVPRSGLQSGALELMADGKAAEASVRLSQPRVLPIINRRNQVLVAQPVKPAVNKPEFKARSLIRMTERYGDEKSDEYQVSWCTVLKKAGGDRDLANQEV